MTYLFLIGFLIGAVGFSARTAAQSGSPGTTGEAGINALGYEAPQANTPELITALGKGAVTIREKWFAGERIKRGVLTTGTTIIECTVKRDGTIGGARLVLSSGDPSLDDGALATVGEALFKGLPGGFKSTPLRFVFFFNLPSTNDRPACDALTLAPFKKAGGTVTRPRALYQPDPDYSEEARRSKYQGSLRLGLTVDTEGLPRDICVEEGLGMGLDEKAIAAVSTWKFEPGRENGVPVPVRINAEVSFALY